MLTRHRHIIQGQFAINPVRPHLHNPHIVWPYANPMLLLAGYLTSPTTITEVRVNKKRFLLFHSFHFISPFLNWFCQKTLGDFTSPVALRCFLPFRHLVDLAQKTSERGGTTDLVERPVTGYK